MMMRNVSFVVALVVSLAAVHVLAVPAAKVVSPATAKKFKVVTTLSVLKSITKEIGGDFVEVTSLSSAADDPHFIKAKPTFKQLIASADLFIQIGRSLELWVPEVLSAAGNKKLTGTGLVSASAGMKALEVPAKLTREKGDIHPEGNPHVWLSPLNAIKMADTIKTALIAHDPAHKAQYEVNYGAFKHKVAESLFGKDLLLSSGRPDFLLRLHEGKKLTSYLATRKKTAGGWLKLAAGVDYTFITYHTVWSYLADEFALKIFDLKIEEKSGVPPSLKYQNELVKKAKAQGVRHIVAASYYAGNSKLIDLIASQISGKKMLVDVDCQENETYVAMMDRILKSLVDFKPLPPLVLPKP
jgi:zinc/manganese transport system substrate-binding protein